MLSHLDTYSIECIQRKFSDYITIKDKSSKEYLEET
ncbi:hypothetical protein EV213_101365 [Aureibacillus halotolerans]|uniref:Uncharacterized protein n=1 Tax=Aureibacillus halotolerans TaxID=1508390 RepID=A0A4R6UDQ6_9BACI|nr:hypothetical protein EV213_101365 [Aureibacillus halotolerans]